MRARTISSAAAIVLVGLMPATPVGAQSYGPQTPRDITQTAGTNRSAFLIAPAASKLNLCNIHFHSGAEHRGPGYLHPVAHGSGSGHGGAAGFQCNGTSKLTAAQLAPPPGGACKGLKPGDTIEVHWVYTSCSTAPGQTLGACVADHCKNPMLRVESQVFLVVNDPTGRDFTKFDYSGALTNGVHQPKSLPGPGARPVVFRGSTTGPSFDETKGSPYEVTWSVRKSCENVDINSLHRWCANNVFKEDHAHGVRKLVTDVSQLDAIQGTAGPGDSADAGAARRPGANYCGGVGNYRNPATGKCEAK